MRAVKPGRSYISSPVSYISSHFAVIDFRSDIGDRVALEQFEIVQYARLLIASNSPNLKGGIFLS